MRETKHTPGPWTAEYDDNGFYFISGSWENGSPSPYIAATGNESSECQANAALMAAAPELYDALQAILDWAEFAQKNPAEFNAHGVKNLMGPAFDKAAALIAKLSGEPS